MVPFVLSTVGIVVYLAHFWPGFPANIALWVTSAILGILSVHHGLRLRTRPAGTNQNRWMHDSAVKMGLLVLLGVMLSAIFYLAPRI